MRLCALQHVPFEDPVRITDWARERGHSLTPVHLYAGEQPPVPETFDGLVVMGGPMSIHDEAEHPWLVGEKTCIRGAIADGKSLLGVCLGAQLIADALGAPVTRNPQTEIGWFPIEFTPEAGTCSLTEFLPERIEVFHWHGDTFALPQGAVRLAFSEACAQQMFAFDNRVLALQCHLESTPESVGRLLTHCADEIVPAAFVQTAERMRKTSADTFGQMNQALFGMLDRLFAG